MLALEINVSHLFSNVLVSGYFLSMISDSQFYVVDPGESVTMECSFHADRYSLFDYPVIWRKRQLTEDLPINILSNINEPFLATNRFDMNYIAREPRYQLELSITGKSKIRRPLSWPSCVLLTSF